MEAEKKKNSRIWIFAAIWAAVILVIVAAITAVTWFNASCSFSDGAGLSLYSNVDGSVRLVWPEAAGADGYRVEISDADTGAVIVSGTAYGTELSTAVFCGRAKITVTPLAHYYIAYFRAERAGWNNIEAVCSLEVPQITDLEWYIDTSTLTVHAEWKCSGDAKFSVRRTDGGAAQELLQTDECSAEVTFGDGGLLPAPAQGETCTLEVYACAEWDNAVAYGGSSGCMTVTRENLYGSELNMSVVNNGDNTFTITWDRTRGDEYMVVISGDNGGRDTAVIDASADRACTTSRLEPCAHYEVTITAYDGHDRRAEDVVCTQTVSIDTDACAVYATVWPNRALDILDAPDGSKIGTATTLAAYCVLEETEDGYFKILTAPGETGYIKSSLCMINLPEYCGELLSYNITNSYSSLYAIHEYSIMNVTGTVIKGYESVRQSSGEYLVPLLYPVAQKLVQAGKAALEQGYRIKIYDSFRPAVATRFIYDAAYAIIDTPLPTYTYKGRQMTGLSAGEDGILKYEDLITGGGWTLGSFLAPGGSYHNFGVAIDMTLEDAETGEELTMQTDMHDLSYFSIRSRNNDAAKTLSGIMTGAGFETLVSEWWHFQDTKTYSAVRPSSMANGVSSEGWTQDTAGIKYRDSRGVFCTSCTTQINGAQYTFDADGYLVS